MDGDRRIHKSIPRWIVLAVVLTTASVTAWAMWKTGLSGPRVAWMEARGAADNVWVETAMNTNTQAPGMMMPQGSAVRPVGLPGVPSIQFDQPRPHGDRGECVRCHTVVDGNGNILPTIRSFSNMPHEFRGVCTNCHVVTIGPTGNPVAATILPTNNGMAGMNGMQPMNGMAMNGMPATNGMQPMNGMAMNGMPAMNGMAMNGMAQPGTRRQAEWRGLEVRQSPQGVIVTGADGTAARAGMLKGDVIVSINANQIRSMDQFIQATQNGKLPAGTVITRRDSQRMAFEITGIPEAGIPAPNAPTGFMPSAQPFQPPTDRAALSM